MTKIIAHRANLYGPNIEYENKPSSIELALDSGFDVEIDIWYVDGRFLLGHDKPIFSFKKSFFEEILPYSWLHCKNLEAINKLSDEYPESNYFWHENDKFTLTSKNFIWTYPGQEVSNKSIVVLPEQNSSQVYNVFGICTDYPFKYKEIIKDVSSR